MTEFWLVGAEFKADWTALGRDKITKLNAIFDDRYQATPESPTDK